jgi:hypothetical protein
MKNFFVIEGMHKDPNQIETILKETEKKYGPFEEQEANQVAKGLIQKNVDDFYHRAWVVSQTK